MSDIHHLLEQIGEDADLLTKPDAWLEEELRHHIELVSRNINELRSLRLAIKIKRLLQEKNLVALQQLIRDGEGNIQDIILSVLKLPDAILELEKSRDDLLGTLNAAGHISLWQHDGYDVETCIEIAKKAMN